MIDFNNYESNLGITVSIHSLGYQDHFVEDVAPLVDALDDKYMFISLSRTHFTPPAAGGGEIAQVALEFVRDNGDPIKAVGAGALGAYIVGFIQKMGEDSWDGVRRILARIVGRESPTGFHQRIAQLTIRIDRPRFVFNETMSEEEFNHRLMAIAEFVKTMPEGALRPIQGPSDFDWYFWSEKKQSWARFSDEQEAAREEWRREHPEAAAQMDKIWTEGWQDEWDQEA